MERCLLEGVRECRCSPRTDQAAQEAVMCSTFPAALRVRRTHLRRLEQVTGGSAKCGSVPTAGHLCVPMSTGTYRQRLWTDRRRHSHPSENPMNRLVTAISMTGVIFAGTQARAVDSASQPKTNKHQTIVQIVGCMKKRMSADRSSSYNAAMKACKEQINKESDNLPSGALVASDTPAKP